MEPLLAPLLERPGDPATLRVLADALLERDDPWGEAISLALDLERTFPGEEAHRLGHRRLARLEERFGSGWRTRLRGDAQTGGHELRFFRGIPSAVGSRHPKELARLLEGPVAKLDYAGAEELLHWPRLSGLVRLALVGSGVVGNGPRLVRAALPSLTALTLEWQGDETVALLEAASCTPQLEQLTLSGREGTISPLQMERLLKLPLPKLRAFTSSGLSVGAAGAPLLAAMPWRLERLALNEAGLGVKGTVALCSSPGLSTVRELSLAGNTMGPKGAEAVAGSPHLTQLVSLDLSSTASGAKALAPLFEGLALPALRAIHLRSCGLKGKALAPLAASRAKGWAQLTLLDLEGNLMGDEGLGVLSEAKLPELRVLRLGHDAVKGPGLVALGHSALLRRVEELTLDGNKFQNAGAKGLAVCKHLGALRVLTLGHNWLGVQGLKGILGNPSLDRLEDVREGMNNYGPELLRSFLASPRLGLWRLRLGPETTTDSLTALLTSPRVASLQLLSLSCAAFDDAMVEHVASGPLRAAATTLTITRAWCTGLTEPGAQKLAAALGPRVAFQ